MHAPRLRELVLERHGCFGTCPVYRVTVDADGFVVWEGRHFVKAEGRRSWRIPRDDVATLERQLERAGFRWLRDYDDPVRTDGSACTIEVEYADGTTMTVRHVHADETAPSALFRLEERIDLVLGTAPYVGPRPNARRAD
ncbi:MAG: DUF6438 domain-containing protein [Burkholderiales bacterium]|nr:DUF6438 domain-containing protein [Burkholderiales bacterium]